MPGTIQYEMTVGKLREQLSKFAADTKVVVHWEEGKPHQCFEIEKVSEHKGTPCHDKSGLARFTFEASGPVAWVFIDIAPE